MRLTRYAAIAIFCLILGGAAGAGDMTMGGGHGQGHGSAMTGMAKWGTGDDIAFLSGMIAHHEGALRMVEALGGKAKDPQVAKWAKDIVSAQKEEIGFMESLLKEAGKRDEAAAADMDKMMQAMLATKASPDPDANFVLLMIPHHAGAIEMSVPALVGTNDPRIRKLAKDIILAQTSEIAAFRDWLEAKGMGGGH